MLLHELGAILVALARNRPRRLLIAEPQARIGDRDHRRGDAALVHVLDRFLRRPRGIRRLEKFAPSDESQPLWRREVVVDVDAARIGRRSVLRKAAHWRAAPGKGGTERS